MNDKPNPFLNPKPNITDGVVHPAIPLDSGKLKARSAKKPQRYIPRGERYGRPRNY